MNTALAIDGFFSPHTDRGVSDEAADLRTRMRRVRDDMSETETLGKSYRETLDALLGSYFERLCNNWDGYGAKPVTDADLYASIRFLDTLPPSLPSAEVSLDPDGEFAFDWYKGSDVLSVSIGRLGRISYAAHFGRSRTHGTEYFADELPKVITENLERLFS